MIKDVIIHDIREKRNTELSIWAVAKRTDPQITVPIVICDVSAQCSPAPVVARLRGNPTDLLTQLMVSSEVTFTPM